MALPYDQALQEWGARKLEEYNPYNKEEVDRSSVVVTVSYDEGFICCGGTDPDCYCSFAESPSCDVKVSGHYVGGEWVKFSYADVKYGFDFVTFIKEVVEAGEGTITSE